MQSDSVNKGIFHFLGAKILASIPVYRYENPTGYITVRGEGTKNLNFINGKRSV